MESITIRRPDDFHVHVRSGPMMRDLVRHTARQFARAIIMPNLRPPVRTVEDAARYRDEILEATAGLNFAPLMTLYLTDATTADDIRRARASGFVHGVKLYPSGATTNSDSGVTNLAALDGLLGVMEKEDLPLLVHGESTDKNVDVFDRENAFLENYLKHLPARFPRLRIVFEHITTAAAVEYVMRAPDTVAATITPHHLLWNRNEIFRGGIRPHAYCLPVLKREEDRQALLKAAASGQPKFFAGTDSAPHERSTKENSCGCAGIYNAHAALELYAAALEQAGALDRLEAFVSEHGARFYRLPLNAEKIQLRRLMQTVPDRFEFGKQSVVPMYAGETIPWSVEYAVST